MDKKNSIIFICLSLFLLAIFTLFPLQCVASSEGDDDNNDDKKTYIIYMGSLPTKSSSLYSSMTSHHLSILQQVITYNKNGHDVSNSLIRSYTKSFNGFAAKLTSDERDKVARLEDVVSVFESVTYRTQTTRSWDFMGFTEKEEERGRRKSLLGKNKSSDVIVGVIDNGIWPESESFSDEGFSRVPKKWKGACAGGKNFTCNKKIIGARVYSKDRDSARDRDGHGTHTASTIAGNIVRDVSFYGIANGTARGGFPSARIAAYVACNFEGNVCKGEDILAAFDDAISDGVDVISVSLGNDHALDLLSDTIAIGSFHAMEKGILTVQSAGNNGPGMSTVSSVAPWILTVGASTTDRKIIDKLVLGNGKTLTGISINSFISNGTKFPICNTNCVDDPDNAKGKIVTCLELPEGVNLKDYGVKGVIENEYYPFDDFADVVDLPSLQIPKGDFVSVVSYALSNKNPKAEIMKSEISKDKYAPKTASFSGRGPNLFIPEILKPDINAPGVDILASYSPLGSVSGSLGDKRSMRYSFLSGTSMACPHVSGISAYLKALHPDWSPSAIKSAILTTAKPMKKKIIDGYNKNWDLVGEFQYGSGLLDPVKASDPGLIYDISKNDYVEMLCNFGFNTSQIKKICGERNCTCDTHSSSHNKDLVKSLNYPSLAAKVETLMPFKVEFRRVVTNVGFANSSYKASISPSLNMSLSVKPEVLSFKSLKEKKSFVVSISGNELLDHAAITSSLVWSDGTHVVRSPIVIISGNSTRIQDYYGI